MTSRVTKEQLEAKIAAFEYVVVGGVLTICVLTMQNGFIVTGESACADPAAFNAEMGRSIAFTEALNKAWGFEGYLLRERLNGVEVAKRHESTGEAVAAIAGRLMSHPDADVRSLAASALTQVESD